MGEANNGYSYLYLVESVREGGRTTQRIIKNLGRKEAVLADGDLDRLQEVTISKRGQQMVLRTPATNSIGPVFKAAGVALPANVRGAPAT